MQDAQIIDFWRGQSLLASQEKDSAKTEDAACWRSKSASGP
jgi:hypothetical protein